MGVEAFHPCRAQLTFTVQGLAEQRFEFGAFDPVFGFLCHHITCL
jgi:hypothetical protein